ncbi:MAG: hypothetical protein QME52_08755 [Bacteroidota bacterium]|nr:hypothetical protein [Bacteroidota bacterium]
MNCKKIERIFIDVLTGEASENDAQLVQEHFSGCSQCRDQFMPMLAMNKTFRNITQHEIPNGYDERFWQKLSAHKAAPELSPPLKFMVEIFGTNVRLAFISIVGALLSVFSPIEPLLNNYQWNIIPTFLLTISLLIITFIIKQSFSWNTLIFYRRKTYENK